MQQRPCIYLPSNDSEKGGLFSDRSKPPSKSFDAGVIPFGMFPFGARSYVGLPFRFVKIARQIHPSAAVQNDPFLPQKAHLRFPARLVRYRDFSLGVDDPMPGQPVLAAQRMQNPHDLPRASRTAGTTGDLSVRHDAAFRYALNESYNL